MTSFSYWILSKTAASGDIKLGFISIEEPKDKFQTLISLFREIISRIALRMENELKDFPVATPKCLTRKRPHPSSSSGLKLGPSTIIEETAVP